MPQVVLASAVFFGGCTSVASSASPGSSAQASATPPTLPSASPSQTVAPSRAASETPFAPSTFDPGDEVAVTAHGAGLAVRVHPSVTAPILAGLTRPDETSNEWSVAMPELRLAAGHVVMVRLGPLCIGDLCWYRVSSTDPLSGWDEDDDGRMDTDSGHSWVAAGDREGPYLELSLAAQAPGVAAAGQHSFTSDPLTIDVEGVGLYADWAIATDGDAPCDFRVSLQPGGLLFVDESLIGSYQEGSTLTQMVPPGEYRLHVMAGVAGVPDAACPWAVAFGRIEPGHVSD